MSAYPDSVAAVRAARAARDAERDRLYALQLRGLELDRAQQRAARGDGAEDPSQTRALAALHAKEAALLEQLDADAAQLAELSGLPDRLAAAQQQVAAADARSAELARMAVALAGELAQDDPEVAERLRAAQQERAAVEQAAVQPRHGLAALTAAQADAQKRAATLEQAASDGRAALEQVRKEIDEAENQQPDLAAAHERNAAELDAQRGELVKLDEAVASAVAILAGDQPPQRLIASWDDGLPILLLPLRLETRWKTVNDAPQLWVRVFPDDVAVATHEKVLTDAEVTAGQSYWTQRQAATTDDERTSAWTALSQRLSANRAAWVARETKPTNWDTASTDPQVTLAFQPVTQTKPDAWTEAPHTRALPDRFVLLGWRGGELRVSELGAPIDDVVVLGPAPLGDPDGTPSISRDPADQTLALGDSFRWVRDFDEAVSRGLGFRIDLDAETANLGLDELVVLGVKTSCDGDDGRQLLEDLIDDQHYARPGFALVPQGTPTNNTDGNDSGYTRAGRDGDESQIEVGPPLFTPIQDRTRATDGQRLADLLGIAYEPLLQADGADLTDNADAVAANRALYAGTLGYYLDHMLDDVVDEDALWTVRSHFTDLVTGRGPIAAIRVGAQPYGILPTSAFNRWHPAEGPVDGVRVALGLADPFEGVLQAILARLDEAWSTLMPGLTRIGLPGDGAAHLLDVLGLQPTSAELYQRVGYSYDTLRNIESFVSSSHELDDVLKLLLEGMAARGLLEELGYEPLFPDGSAKPQPLLLQLIWRHYQTQLDTLQLVDGQPLSETAQIKPYDAASGKNFIDWLLDHASDGNALEAQDFGAAPRPGSLLYLLLHFSVAMESAHGLFRLLTGLGVQADPLVRSSTFLNVGARPTPSTWEVFRAPTSAVVPSVASDRPLLEVLHTPQFAGDAGQGVAEQRDALLWLRDATTARLERALIEHVDTLGYRLDAWQTSLVTRRLHRQRGLDNAPDERRLGVYLGAYGYLENAHPASGERRPVAVDTLPPELQDGTGDLVDQVGNGGYVHASSLNHASAAALLRSGYLTHATPARPDTLAVNLSSDRVRRARSLLEGIRNGQSLEVLLGAQFERGLHDWTTRPVDPVILDQLKPLFRAQFPIRLTRVPQSANAAAGAATVTEDHEVVNGLDLAQAAPFPWGIPQLTTLSADQQTALQREQDAIADTLDALRDLLTAEAAFQLALGNFDRAAAVVQSVGSGNVPPDIQIADTPRSTDISFTNRLAVQLKPNVATNPWPVVGNLTERAQLEPALNHWLGGLLPDPANVHCSVQAHAADDGHVIATGTVTLAELGIQPLDVVSIVRSQQQSSMAELEARVRYVFARANAVPDDAVVQITFGDAGGAGEASFAEALPLADALRSLLGSAKPLDARHFQSASKDAPQAPDNPGRIDVAELTARVTARLDAVRLLFRNPQAAPAIAPLERVLADARTPGAVPGTVDDLRASLLGIADAGFVYAFPVSSVGTGAEQLQALGVQADSVLARHDALAPQTDAQLADIAASTASADRKVEQLTDVVRGWLGGDLLLIPHFTFIDPTAVADADAARDGLLDHALAAGSPLPVDEWLHGAACVRPLVHGFELVRIMAEAHLAQPLALSPIQLPFRTGDSWLGAEFPPGTEVVHDTAAIVQHLPQGFTPAAAQSGLLLDEWGESVPGSSEVTGIGFNYDAPNSAPPQALLLAVTPQETGSWSWDDLVETVRDTFRRARLRAVEPDVIGGLPGIGTLLPAVIAEFSTGRSSVSLDYSFTWASIRERAADISSSHVSAGGGGG